MVKKPLYKTKYYKKTIIIKIILSIKIGSFFLSSNPYKALKKGIYNYAVVVKYNQIL
jgi:hypothetical protein